LLKPRINLAPKAGMSAGASFLWPAQMVGGIFEGSRPRPLKGERKEIFSSAKVQIRAGIEICEIANFIDASFPLRWAWV
jgi:hypothetical protein